MKSIDITFSQLNVKKDKIRVVLESNRPNWKNKGH